MKGLTYFNRRFHHLEKGSNFISNMLPTLYGKWKIVSLPPPSIQLQPTLYKNGIRLNRVYRNTALYKQHVRDLKQPTEHSSESFRALCWHVSN